MNFIFKKSNFQIMTISIILINLKCYEVLTVIKKTITRVHVWAHIGWGKCTRCLFEARGTESSIEQASLCIYSTIMYTYQIFVIIESNIFLAIVCVRRDLTHCFHAWNIPFVDYQKRLFKSHYFTHTITKNDVPLVHSCRLRRSLVCEIAFPL